MLSLWEREHLRVVNATSRKFLQKPIAPLEESSYAGALFAPKRVPYTYRVCTSIYVSNTV